MRPIVVLALPVLVLRATAGLIPGPDIARRIEQSDTIVVGTLRGGTTSAAGDRTSSTFVLHVDRVLKGRVIPGTEIAATIEGRGAFIYTQTSVLPIPLQERSGIWFLKSGGGIYTVVPRAPDYGELHLAAVWLPSEAPPAEPTGTPAGSVANELISALRWMAATHGDDLKPAPQAGIAGDRQTQHRVFGKYAGRAANLAEELRTLPAEFAGAAYRQLAEEQSAHLRSIAIAGMISINDPEGPKRASAEWKALSAATDVSPIVQSLIGYHNGADPAAVQAIARIAEDSQPVPGLKENASYALRVLHTREAMPALVALLDASEPSVRANALSGICLFIRNATTVTPDASVRCPG